MRKMGLLGSSALRSVAFMGLAIAGAAPAMAQETTVDQDPPETLQSEAEIESGTEGATEGDGSQGLVVTGSRIRRPNLESTVPITSVGGEEFFQTGQVSVGDVLNELPALRSTFSQANSTRFLGTGGLSLLDLRGLGTQRTLVLQNGRRHIGSNVLGNAVEVDVNTIPTDLIERVDVVTGGNSAIYGSDAIAGVVNFILKRDFEGIQIRGQGGISTYGDAGSYYGSILAGQNFADGRGNVAVNLEYARQNPFFGSGRPNIRRNDNFIQVDTDPAGSVNGADGIPDRVFFRDIRSATPANGGITFNTGACGRDPQGANYSCLFQFDENGRLAQSTAARAGLAPLGSFIGGNAFNPRLGNVFGVYPETDRYSANAMGHFTISEAFEPFFEAKYVRTDSNGLSNAGPAFSTGGTIEGFRERPRLDNPFLTPENRAIIEAQLRAANPNANITDATRFSLRRGLYDLGNRNESSRRETYRLVGGIRGDISPVWNYEISANYGRLDEKTVIEGNLNVQRFVLATDAARDPVTGQIVCRSRFDPAAREIYPFATDLEEAERRLADDVAACVPYNQFGNNNSAAARNYLIQDTLATGRLTQFVVNGFISGDTSSFFNLPGGPVGIAIGGEYRRETAFYDQDELVAAGLTFYNAIPALDPPNALKVKEVFGELRFPILTETPFFHELTVTAAGRASDYNGATGTVYAYNAGVDWAPIRDLRLRANYSRAVRAPNLADLFTAQGQNFALPFSDPCAANFIGVGSPNRAANCAAAGRPADFNFLYLESLGFTSGGNPELREETSDSFTVGGVFTPRFLPGFSLSVDYYDIQVDDVITTPTAQQIVDACYDLPDLDNQFCALFDRAGPAGGPQGEQQFRILEGSLQATLLNYAALKTRGIDVEAAYRRNLDGIGNLSARINYTHVLQNDEFLDPTNPDFANQLLKELNYEQDALNLNVDLKANGITYGYQLRYIGKMVVNQFEDFFSKQDRPPQDADYADRIYYPSVVYHDARIGFDAGDDFEFYIGVDNFTNRKPPLGLTGVGGGSGVYNSLGRFFYAGAVAKF